MIDELILDDENLLPVKDTALFYPCSGSDFYVPIILFSSFVTDFWFIDRGYFSPNHQDTRYSKGLDAPADQQPPLLKDNPDYQFIDKDVIGPPTWNWHVRDIEPCILTETYVHVPSNRQIKVHRRRGYGVSAFQKEIASLGVFFYRGDSQGEGGSGNLWLYTDRINAVCNKLVEGGLIVTDGSQHSPKKDHIYKELWKYHWQDWRECSMTGKELINSVQPFTDQSGRHFTCIGYAGRRYGPTLIWQVRKSNHEKADA